MLWSLIKILIFLALATAIAFGAGYILETPGGVQIAFGNREIHLSPMGFVIALVLLFIAVWVAVKIIGFLSAVLRFLLGDETAISRYFNRARERKGFDALSDGMIALASGDGKTAQKKAVRADKLLKRPDVTSLLSAHAAEMNGDSKAAAGYYKDMLAGDRTRFAGIQGLMKQKLDEGDTDTALALAQKAFALRPANKNVLRTLFDLQSEKQDWAGARNTLNASINAKLLPRDVGTRRDAVLSLADARVALASGADARASDAALQANKLAPTLIPAAAMAAEVHTRHGAKRRAIKVLTAAWAASPHPDLAAAFAAIEPDETPAARRKRFEKLIDANPDDPESHLLMAELAIADEDFPGARKALGGLAENLPTTRSLAIMAAIERGQGASEAVVRGWLARALNASRGPQWICSNCNEVHGAWEPVCSNCGAFDTLAWTTVPHSENAALAQSTMLPLIIGALEDKPAPQDAPANGMFAEDTGPAGGAGAQATPG